jgi:histidinol-phosphatase (PHP family)
MVRVDNHSHIILADIRDMVAAARAMKVDRYSITEHVSQFREMKDSVDFGSTHGEGRIFEDLGEYRREFTRVDEHALAGMKLRMGLEVDFSPRYEDRVGEFVNQEKWDILLCSVHELGDRADIEHPRKKPIDPTEADKLWREYFDLEQKALESDVIPCDVLTHPTRMIKGASRLPDDIDDLLMDLAKTAKRRNKALELNGKDIGYAPELVRRVAKACSKAGCTVSLGSDSHYPQDVFRNMEVAIAMLEEFGLQQM